MVDKDIKPITVKTYGDSEMTCTTKYNGADNTNQDIHNDAFRFAEFIYNNTSAAFWEPFSRAIWNKVKNERRLGLE